MEGESERSRRQRNSLPTSRSSRFVYFPSKHTGACSLTLLLLLCRWTLQDTSRLRQLPLDAADTGTAAIVGGMDVTGKMEERESETLVDGERAREG